ncbi:hypothetical protein DFR58_101109 [Anaerobacterium chartisolvens]|uniref:Uncharacterized protein n=1 Tax=Anaerobacterium chartisolvens TaxID=1297424 RepID=A0A369BKA9_9FIRM|nr:hypothetical protein [Anaerobacterium chartisolvens]RCX20907.1 hypothetical protein DFR58_101109 [Anaerobacterium chartisolvens]
MFIHCRNSDCINYLEDSCMINLNGDVVHFNEYGNCEDFAQGTNDAYELMEEAALEEANREAGDNND